jgi:membrane-associated phospholipid phosphatase
VKTSVRIWITAIIVIASLYVFGVITHEVLSEKEETADKIVSDFVHHHFVSDGATQAMKYITYFASKQFLIIAFVLLALWCIIYKKDRRLAVESLIIGISGYLINASLKETFKRVRPADPLMDPLRNFSYPSGHASSGIIFYGLLAYLIWRSDISRILKYILSVLLIAFALLIGFSRIYLGMHYASDVAAGFCIGFAWLIVCLSVATWLRRKDHRI